MADPRFSGPPEQVALIFEAGNPASVVANNAVWVTETANKELSAGLSTVNAFATAANWQGVGAVASLVANTGLNAGLTKPRALREAIVEVKAEYPHPFYWAPFVLMGKS